jgi:uncharacterized repeat protein (TIGR04138 family)
MPAASIIPSDLPCIVCGYNLRTLTVEGQCPECGQPVVKTLEKLPGGSNPLLEDLLIVHRRKRYEAIAGKAGCTVDAVLLVLDACRHAAAQHATLDQGRRHVSPGHLCEALATHVRFYFNDADEGVELLSEWGIRTSEDVGRIIFTMVEAGWMATTPGESESDFAGLFTLDTLFDQAG